MKTYEFKDGCLSELPELRVHKDFTLDIREGDPLCHHVTKEGIVPWMLEGFNQGGHDVVWICMQCAEESIEQIKMNAVVEIKEL